MTKRTVHTVAAALGVLAALFYIAPSFDILPKTIGAFLGIASGLVAGLFWGFSGPIEQ